MYTGISVKFKCNIAVCVDNQNFLLFFSNYGRCFIIHTASFFLYFYHM